MTTPPSITTPSAATGAPSSPAEEQGAAPLMLGFGVILIVLIGVRLLAARRKLGGSRAPVGLAEKAIELRARYALADTGPVEHARTASAGPSGLPPSRPSTLTARVESLERAMRRAEARIGELERRLTPAPLMEAKQPAPLVQGVRAEILRLASQGVGDVQISEKLGVTAAEVRMVLAIGRAA